MLRIKNENYSKEIVAAIMNFLEENNFNYQFEEECGEFTFRMDIPNRIESILYSITVKEDSYCTMTFPKVNDKIVNLMRMLFDIEEDADAIEVDAATKTAMAEFVCIVNSKINNGSFGLNMSSGQINFRSYVDCDGWIPNAGVIANGIRNHASAYRLYGEGFLEILFNHMSGRQAADKCESDEKERRRAVIKKAWEERQAEKETEEDD